MSAYTIIKNNPVSMNPKIISIHHGKLKITVLNPPKNDVAFADDKSSFDDAFNLNVVSPGDPMFTLSMPKHEMMINKIMLKNM